MSWKKGKSGDGTDTIQRSSLKSIAFLGDSVTGNAQDGSPSAPLPRLRSHGYIPWALFFSGHRLHFPHQWNFGQGGDNSTDVLSRINSVLAARPDYCVVETGGVDGKLGYTVEQTVSNLRAIYDKLERIGVRIIAVTMYPNQGPTQYSRQHIINVNRWVREQARVRPNFSIVEGATLFTDFTLGANTDARADYVSDGTHPGPNGAAALGKALADVINKLEKQRDFVSVDPADFYDATNNPAGNILPNIGFITANGGTAQGAVTGTIPSGWTVGTTGGATVSCAVVNDPDALGLKQLELTIGGTGASSTANAYIYAACFVPTKNTPMAGHVYQHSVDIEMIGGVNLSAPSLQIMPEALVTKTPTASFLEVTSLTSTPEYVESNFVAIPSYKGRLITPPALVTASNQGVYFCIKLHTLSNRAFAGKFIIKNAESRSI